MTDQNPEHTTPDHTTAEPEPAVFSHAPHHAPRNLAARTLTAVLSTLILALTLTVIVLGLPQGLTAAFQGPTPSLASLEVQAAEPDRVLACMGPAISFSGQDSSPVGYGSATDVLAGSALEVKPVAETDLQDAFSLEGALVPQPALIISQSAEQGLIGGTSFQQLDNLNVRGLAVAECQEPRVETWLVGGDTTTGRQAVLSLINPGAVSASVNVEVWGQNGPISSPLSQGILVSPGAQRVLSLAGLAPNESRPVLRVTSTGTAVVAALHSTIVRGLESDGLSVITGQAPPSNSRVVGGLFGPPEEVIGPIRGKEGYADVGGLLRVLSPEQNTTVVITIVRPALGNIQTQLQLLAGQVGDLSLDEIGSGEYAVILESEHPIVAGVRNSVGTETRTDTSWVGSSYALQDDTVFAVPGFGETRISIVNAGSTSVSVSIDGRSTPLAGGAMITRPITPGEHRLSADGPVFAVVSIRGDTTLGHAQVLPAPIAQEPVRLRVR
jgi:hypothetical protein